ncbi:hypothetical protein MP228_010934 [Amoeboaphelidium protococcarum]|nr:hypothetical protein MP228_010934 [Amoeboaphelidium protococcarum]
MDNTIKQMQQVVDMIQGKPNNAKFFNTPVNKRGEIYELKNELNGDTKYIRKDAVKKVIASMTIGKDVSMLFADVVKNMQTDDLELKKLVYLYLINYAKSQPELVILAINTFVKDCDDINPLIRAMAIRTMGCLKVQKMLDYMCEPLKKALKDDHPYVRKTAALCVVKLYDLSPSVAQENGFIQILQDMLADQNPTVIANAVAAIVEIHQTSSQNADGSRHDVLQINASLLNKLLTALNECTEWGQIYIMEALCMYVPQSSQEAEQVVERVLPRLQHVNSSVVLNAVKLMINYMQFIKKDDVLRSLTKKLSPPLVTLLSNPPEIQYVILKNIDLIVQRYPEVLSENISVFFCKYNDTPYVKLEKLKVIIRLVGPHNVDAVLGELKEYAKEVDVDFVRTSIQAIGSCAIKIDTAAERCVNALVDLIKIKVNYVVQEAVIVIKDIFRKYPNKFENVIPVLCENLENLDEPEAKASMIWIIGENAGKIQNAQELIQFFCESWKLEVPLVQTQLLTATVKLFCHRPAQAQQLVQQLLQMATTSSDSADLRDKAYIYWRLLAADPRLCKAVVMSEKPPIAFESTSVPQAMLNDLLKLLSTVASVYQKPPHTFLSKYKTETSVIQAADKEEADEEKGEDMVQTGVGDLLDLDFGTPAPAPASNSGNKSGITQDLFGSIQQQQPSSPYSQSSFPIMVSPTASQNSSQPAVKPSGNELLDLLGDLNMGSGMQKQYQPQQQQQQYQQQPQNNYSQFADQFSSLNVQSQLQWGQQQPQKQQQSSLQSSPTKSPVKTNTNSNNNSNNSGNGQFDFSSQSQNWMN